MTKRRLFVSGNTKRRVLTKWSMSGTNLRWPKSVKTQRFKKIYFLKDLGHLTNRKKITCSTWHPRNSLFLKPTWISKPPRTPCAQHGSPGTIPLQRRRQGFRCYSQTRPRDRGPAGLASWLRSQGHRHACSRPVVDDSSRLFNKQINRFISYLVLSNPHDTIANVSSTTTTGGCYSSRTWQAGREARV